MREHRPFRARGWPGDPRVACHYCLNVPTLFGRFTGQLGPTMICSCNVITDYDVRNVINPDS